MVKTFIKGILAGLAIGLGGILFLLVKYYISASIWTNILASCVFPVGLLLICFLKLNLYTGKVGFCLNGATIRKDNNETKTALINLLIMLVGNIVGAVSLGIIFHFIVIGDPNFVSFLTNVSASKIVGDTFMNYLYGFGVSVGCGVLVYLAVFFFKYFKNVFLKAISIVVFIAIFVYFGLFHCIANAFYYGAGFFFDYRIITYFLICVLGNSVGSLLINYVFFGIFKLCGSKRINQFF